MGIDEDKEMELEFNPIDRKSTVQRIVDKITSSLLDDDVSAGDKIPSEKKLMEQFGVSRGTIRQSLQILISMGVLASVPGKGYYVTRGYYIPIKAEKLKEYLLADRSFFQSLEARRMVEKNVIKLAAEKATKEDFLALDKAVEMIQTKESLPEKLKAARQVHLQIAKCTHNDVLVGIMEQLLMKIEAGAKENDMSSVAAYEHHKELVEEVKKGDPDSLDSAVDEHLGFVREEFMEELEEKEELESRG